MFNIIKLLLFVLIAIADARPGRPMTRHVIHRTTVIHRPAPHYYQPTRVVHVYNAPSYGHGYYQQTYYSGRSSSMGVGSAFVVLCCLSIVCCIVCAMGASPGEPNDTYQGDGYGGVQEVVVVEN